MTLTAPAHEATLAIYPWIDPITDSVGHPVRSDYVEQFWLGVLGPTATWLLRRLVAGFDHYPDGYELDLYETAQALGTTYKPGHESPFTRAIDRVSVFGMAQKFSGGLAVRTRVPQLTERHLGRLPRYLREAHREYVAA